MPVVGQAVWQKDAPSGLVDQLDLHLGMKARYILLKAWSDPPVRKKVLVAELPFSGVIGIDFTLL